MRDNQFIHQIYAVRYIKNGVNSFGEPNYSGSTFLGAGSSSSASTVYIPARVEGYDAIVQYRESNLRSVNKTIIYVQPAYNRFQIHDEVYLSNGIKIGILSGINEAIKGTTTDVDHYELIVENP